MTHHQAREGGRLRLPLLLSGLLATLLLTASFNRCPPAPPKAQITSNIISTAPTLGSATDANTARPPQTYIGPGQQAEDGQTTAESDAVQFNQVGGNVHAIPGPNPVNEDAAVARSFSKVITQIVVTQADAFTFNTELDMQGVKFSGRGTVRVGVRATVLNANGGGLNAPNSSLASVDYEFQPDGTVILNNDTANPDKLDANNAYKRTIAGPSGGLQLQPGNYRLELELRLVATAPVPEAKAEVDKATLRIALRP